MNPTRPSALSTNGVVATPHYLASQAGVRILQEGGSAVDAAVAANAVLQVVYPHNCSPGGDAFWIMYDPGQGHPVALNGSGRAPAAAALGRLRERGLTQMPLHGPLPVTVPGAVDSWHEALRRFGRLGLERVLAPAIAYAEDGFPATPKLCNAIARSAGLLALSPAAAAVLLPDGRVPRPGQRVRNPDLATTYRTLVREGPDAFYRGAIAQRLAAAVQQLGGLLTADDLAAHTSDWVEPLSMSYRGHDVYELPPNSQGLTALIALAIVEGFDLAALPPRGLEWQHLLVEAKRLAFTDRDAYLTDPAAMQIPVHRLVSKEHAAERRRDIDRRRAGPSRPPGHPQGGDTIYLCVVDRDGQCVSLIQSLYHSFGSGIMAPGTGVLLQNRGAYFSLRADHPNVIAPRKRTLHTLMPALMLRDGRPYLVFGSMGGDGQAQTHLQLVTNIVDARLDVQEAIDAPRWLSGGEIGGHGPEPLLMEERFPPEVRAGLAAMGHDVVALGPWEQVMGHAQAIMLREDGVLAGGADPRGDGLAAAW
ncbi:MAG TPA: gamma-glutamyltransferase [Chloroflexota bacterium]|nr:gamma-glutamyltransferase [Chloroflexota bacterium]